MFPLLITAQTQSQSFGINGGFLVAQILNLLILIAYIWLVCKAIVRASKKGEGIEVPFWIFAIVLLPIFGAVAALIHYPNPTQKQHV